MTETISQKELLKRDVMYYESIAAVKRKEYEDALAKQHATQAQADDARSTRYRAYKKWKEALDEIRRVKGRAQRAK
jgi:hypothetical protein